MIPCYNEVENVRAIGEAVENIITTQLPEYDYEICYVDNASNDGTREIIEKICTENSRMKAIFNVTNFGQFNSPFHGMCALDGDCVIPVCADFQDPVEMIPVFVHEWEKGHRIVSGVKSSSRENRFVYMLRSVYYKLIKNMSQVKMIEHFTGFGLYDSSFIKLLRELDDPLPFIRGIVAEYGEGFNLKLVEYEQPLRKAGKSHNNFYTLYDAAMLSITSYTKVGLRLMTFLSVIIALVDIIVAIVYLVLKLTNWYGFQAGYAPLIIGMFLLAAVILFFMGLMGEYILNINIRTIHRPVVVEEKRINF
jgi:glycosyltransferase involved in cell wall biosynthesis